MRLHNLLTQPGGIALEGRPVTLRLMYKGPDGTPHTKELAAQMLPLSQVEIERAKAAAQKAEGRELVEVDEYAIRILQASLRDPADLSRLLIEDETDLRALRMGLVPLQYPALLDEYRQLIESEYPELVTKKDVAEMEGEARDFSKGGQPAPG